MSLSLVLPGHGEPIVDHVALIDERFRLHRRRAEKIHRLIASATPHGARDRPGAVGERRGHPGLPDALGGAWPRRSAARRRTRRGGGEGRRGSVQGRLRAELALAVARSQMIDVGPVCRPRAGFGGEPRVEDLRQLGLGGAPQAEREHVRIVPAAGSGAVAASRHSAARTPSTLLAAIEAPVPVQQQTTPCSARPSATSRAAASEAHAQSSRSLSLRAPWASVLWPRRSTRPPERASHAGRSSAATEIHIPARVSPIRP